VPVAIDLPTLIKFLSPALTAMLGMVPAGSAAYFLAQLALTLLGQFSTSAGHVNFGATASPPVELPPQHEWTPDGIAKWAEQKAEQGEDGA
jgi:hypothetical protein